MLPLGCLHLYILTHHSTCRQSSCMVSSRSQRGSNGLLTHGDQTGCRRGSMQAECLLGVADPARRRLTTWTQVCGICRHEHLLELLAGWLLLDSEHIGAVHSFVEAWHAVQGLGWVV